MSSRKLTILTLSKAEEKVLLALAKGRVQMFDALLRKLYPAVIILFKKNLVRKKNEYFELTPDGEHLADRL